MVAAARDVFGRRGYRAASMDEIAAAARITKPMLYAYFDSKEGLFAACIKEAGEEFRASVRAAAGTSAAANPEERLWRGLLAVFAGIERNREAWDLLYPLDGEAPGGVLGVRASYGIAAMTELVAGLMADAARERGLPDALVDQTAPLAHALAAAVMALADWWRRHPEEGKELQATRAMNLAWRGLERVMDGELWLPAGLGEP